MSEAVLELPNHPLYVGAAKAFAGDFAGRVGFSAEDQLAIAAAVDEACAFVLNRSQDETLSYRLAFRLAPQGLYISVRDQALPFDPQQPAEGTTTHLGVELMKAMMDQIRFINRGKAGNEVLMLKRFKGRIHGTVHSLAPVTSPPPEEMTVRPILPREALGVSRCIYRAYGYTYSGVESIYSPEWVHQMTRQGDLISVVAIVPDDLVVGHAALLRLGKSQVYELGLAAVSPEFRGRGIFGRITQELIAQARERSLSCLVSQPVCQHPFSQKALSDFGFLECGLCLACIPNDEKVKGEQNQRHRGSLMDTALLLGDLPQRDLSYPESYRGIIDKTLERFGQRRGQGAGRPQRPRLSSDVHPPMRRAVVRIRGEMRAELLDLLRGLLAEGMAVVWAELALDDPATPGNVEFLNQHGFFYASSLIAPERDLLRLQYLSHIEFEADNIAVVSPWGQELKEFVLADYARYAEHRL